MEYFGVSYTITDSVYGSTFYMGTGLILGPIYLFVKNNLEVEIEKENIIEKEGEAIYNKNENIPPY
jgi:cytochrome c oxidase subunit III